MAKNVCEHCGQKKDSVDDATSLFSPSPRGNTSRFLSRGGEENHPFCKKMKRTSSTEERSVFYTDMDDTKEDDGAEFFKVFWKWDEKIKVSSLVYLV